MMVVVGLVVMLPALSKAQAIDVRGTVHSYNVLDTLINIYAVVQPLLKSCNLFRIVVQCHVQHSTVNHFSCLYAYPSHAASYTVIHNFMQTCTFMFVYSNTMCCNVNKITQ